MADSFTTSPLKRARIGVEIWLDLLPEDTKIDAKMALERLCEVAEKEIQQSYMDGDRHSRDGRRADEARPSQS
jgi:hypothetical protein